MTTQEAVNEAIARGHDAMERAELPADRVLVNLTSAQVHAIDQLRALGYGNSKATPASVVEYIVARFIDDMRRVGIVNPPQND